MYRGKTVAVVVPAYNEEGFVGDVLESIPEFADRIYAIDDCSSDGTWEEIKSCVNELSEQSAPAKADGGTVQSRLLPIRHGQNKGVGGAIKTGYKHALQENMDVTAVINGDGQMDPDILHRIIDPVVEEKADYAKGNRLLNRKSREDMHWWRFTGNTLLTFLTKVSSGYWEMNDPQNGYTAVSLEALEALDFDSLYDRYGFCNDMLVKLNANGFRVTDVPMKAVYGDEESDISYASFVPGLSVLLFRNFLWRLKEKYVLKQFHPLILFYSLGVTGIVLTVASATWAAISSGMSLVSVLLMGVLGLLSGTLIAFAMIFDKLNGQQLENHIRQ